MQSWQRLFGVALSTLLLMAGCGKGKNPFNPGFFKGSEGQYQTVTEETTQGNGNKIPSLNPNNGVPFAPLGPEVPPPPGYPLLDPLTSGPALPPPPPPFDDEGDPDRPLIVVPRCGDRVLENIVTDANVYVSGEQCEDGNNISGDGCSDICLEEYCGNGLLEPEHGEQCDGGLQAANKPPLFPTPQGPNCDRFCRLIICGDGVVQQAGTGTGALPAEQCDLGPKNGPCSGCTTSCQLRTACVNNVCTCDQDSDD